MALQDMPLSDLDSASSVGNTDLMYLVQSGESKKVTAQTLIGEKADLSNGKLLLAQFPNTSKEVLNDTARFALTTDDVRNGFIVVVSQPTEKMYLVTDETNLDNASGYTAFAADAMWSSIQGKPNNLVVYETAGNVSTLKSEGGTALNPKTTTEALVDENGVSCKDRIAYGEESAPVTVEPMSPYLHESDIVNDLATNDPTKPLSAAQGYALNSNIAALPIIQRGNAPGSTGLISVTFDTPFSSAPTVVVSAYGTDSNANNRVAVVRAVSAVGFQAKVSVANTGGDASTSIMWIAVGA